MTRPEAWRRLCQKYPHFLTSGATFTPKGVKQFFDWTWHTAQDDGTDDIDADLPDVLKDLIDGKGVKQ